MRNKFLFSVIATSMLTAMAIVLKAYVSISTPVSRVTVYDVPLMIVGMIFGPLAGAGSGFICDMTYSILRGYGIIPSLYTLSSVLWGLIPGIMFMFFKRKRLWQVSFVVVITSVFATVANSVAIAYEQAFVENSFLLDVFINAFVGAILLPTRIIPLCIKWPIQVLLLHIVYNRVWMNVKSQFPTYDELKEHESHEEESVTPHKSLI